VHVNLVSCIICIVSHVSDRQLPKFSDLMYTEANYERTSWMDDLFLDRAPDDDVWRLLPSPTLIVNKANAIIPFRLTCFRAGDAHAGVLSEQSSCVSIAMLMLVSKVVRMRMTYHLTPTEF
jgi:hypothetical protein